MLDATNIEIKYIQAKFPNSYKLIDLEVRNVFSKGIVPLLMIKYYYRYNQYTTREKKINNRLIIEDCSRCSRRED